MRQGITLSTKVPINGLINPDKGFGINFATFHNVRQVWYLMCQIIKTVLGHFSLKKNYEN